MRLSQEKADEFIKEYSLFLFEVAQAHGAPDDAQLLEILAFGRQAFLSNPTLLNEYQQNYQKMPSWIFNAISNLMVKNWVYLKDTSQYSVFVNTDENKSYAVIGLTEPVKNIFDRSGMYIETGVFICENSYICDGIFSNAVVIETNNKKRYSKLFQEQKSLGFFYKKPVAE